MEKFPGCVGALSTKLMFTQQTFRQVVKNCKLLRECLSRGWRGETTTNNLHKQCPLTFYAPKQNACILQWMLRLLNYYSPDNGGRRRRNNYWHGANHGSSFQSTAFNFKKYQKSLHILCSLRPRIRFYPIIG